MSSASELTNELTALVDRAGREILEDATDFGAALEDHLAPDVAGRGVTNLLVDAVRQGSVARLLRDVDQGADPARAVETHGDQLASDRAAQESGPSRWAVAVLGHAAGVVDAQVLATQPTPDGVERSTRPAGAQPTQPAAGPPPTPPAPLGPPPAGPPHPSHGAPAPGRRAGPLGWVVAGVVAALVLVGAILVAVLSADEDDDPSQKAGASASADNSSGGPTEGTTSTDQPPAECEGKFPDGSAMAELSAAGEISVVAHVDQPGLGTMGTDADTLSGFDVEMAKLLIEDLCIDPESSAVSWEQLTPDTWEPALQTDAVDLVVATYTITDERRAKVGQAGPYLETGQQLLVRANSNIDSIDDLSGKKICGIEGSTTAQAISAAGAVLDPATSYEECADRVADGTVPAASTDGALLLGLAREHDDLKVVGPELTEEGYGIGYPRNSSEMCAWINGVLERAFDDGTWEKAYQDNLGGPGVTTPDPPDLDPC